MKRLKDRGMTSISNRKVEKKKAYSAILDEEQLIGHGETSTSKYVARSPALFESKLSKYEVVDIIDVANIVTATDTLVVEISPLENDPLEEKTLTVKANDAVDPEAGRGVEGFVIKSKHVISAHHLDGSKRDVKTAWKKGMRSENFINLVKDIRIARHPTLRRHPNIIKLLAVSWRRTAGHWSPALLLELATQGNLVSFLSNNNSPFLTFSTRLKFALDIAHGLSALHDCDIVWGDQKPMNVLVFETGNGDDPFILKLCDFGAAYGPGYNDMATKSPPANKFWVAPEDFEGGDDFDADKRREVYVFGLMIWYLFALKEIDIFEYGLKHCLDPISTSCEEIRNAFGLHLQASAPSKISFSPTCSLLDFERIKAALNFCFGEIMPPKLRMMHWVISHLENNGIEMSHRRHGGPIVKNLPIPDYQILEIASHHRKSFTSVSFEAALILQLSKRCGICLLGQDALDSEQDPKKQAAIKQAAIRLNAIKQHAIKQSVVATVCGIGDPLESVGKIDVEVCNRRRAEITLATIPSKNISSIDECTEAMCFAASIFDIDRLKLLYRLEHYCRISKLGDEGYSPLACALRSDDPAKLFDRLCLYDDSEMLDRQIQTINLLLNEGSDIYHVSSSSDTVLTCAARYGTAEIMNHLLKSKMKPFKEQINVKCLAKDGKYWTPLRAAMMRHDSDCSKIFQALLVAGSSVSLRFENNYTYMHLLAFRPEATGSSSDLEMMARELCSKNTFALSVDTLAVSKDGLSRETPLATAVFSRNRSYTMLLYQKLKRNADPFISLVPPSITPPIAVKGWFEADVIPGTTYKSVDLESKSSRRWKFAPFFLFPIKELCLYRPLPEFLLEYCLRVGFKGPYMVDNWVRYETLLDRALVNGWNTQDFVDLIRNSKNRSHSRLVEWAIGIGIKFLYEQGKLPQPEVSPDVLEHITANVKYMLESLGKNDLCSKIILKSKRPHQVSHFDRGNFLWSYPAECATTLLHIACKGGLKEIVESFREAKIPMRTDGSGITPLEAVEKRINKVKKSPYPAHHQRNKTIYLERLEAIREDLSRPGEWAYRSTLGHLRKTQLEFLFMALLLTLTIFLPMMCLQAVFERIPKTVGYLSILMSLIFTAVLFIVVLQTIVLNIPHNITRFPLYLRRREMRRFLKETIECVPEGATPPASEFV